MYCLDTYALLAFLNGSKKYKSFFNQEFVITDWTITELYWVLLRDFNEKTADYWLKKLGPYVQKPSLNLLSEAMKFRLKNKKNKFSYFDCIGYLFAQKNKLKFLTGDKEFQKFKGVEFRK